MSTAVASILVNFTTPTGDVAGRLEVKARRPDSLFALDVETAVLRGEERHQLVEGQSYEYRLQSVALPDFRVRETSVIQPSLITSGTGRIETGLWTGLMPIVLENHSGVEVAHAKVEVRSSKLDYHGEYRYMLDHIAEACIGLLLDIHAPSQVRLAADQHYTVASLHERFAFIRHLVAQPSFHEAMQRILAVPHDRSQSCDGMSDIRHIRRPNRSLASATARDGQRFRLPPTHPLYQRMSMAGAKRPSLPASVSSQLLHTTRNTPENQFVKHALTDFLSVFTEIEDRLAKNDTAADRRIVADLRYVRKSLADYLHADLFKDVGMPTHLPLGSSVLQRRNGYREVLAAWIKFSVASKLSWAGGTSVFGGGKKDVSILYEYWLFFVLLEIVSEELNVTLPRTNDLLSFDERQIDVRLKAGQMLTLLGTYNGASRQINVRFSYNRTFPGQSPNSGSSYPNPGSWTRAMRPDFSLSFWPAELQEAEAEHTEHIVHLHFDAKYKVDSLTTLFGLEDSNELDIESEASRTNTRPKRSDLLKMHAYRDAIRRTEGAYVLYPGIGDGDLSWIQFHEIIPGLGAFAVKPGHEHSSKKAISRFLRDVLHHLSNSPKP